MEHEKKSAASATVVFSVSPSPMNGLLWSPH